MSGSVLGARSCANGEFPVVLLGVGGPGCLGPRSHGNTPGQRQRDALMVELVGTALDFNPRRKNGVYLVDKHDTEGEWFVQAALLPMSNPVMACAKRG